MKMGQGSASIGRFEKRSGDRIAGGIRLLDKRMRRMLTGKCWQEHREGS